MKIKIFTIYVQFHVLNHFFGFSKCEGSSECQEIIKCEKSKYRSIDGSCNNLLRPDLGKSNTPFSRIVAPLYEDGVKMPVGISENTPYPTPRELSLNLFPTNDLEPHPKLTLLSMSYGQFISHDMSFSPGVSSGPQCCLNGKLNETVENCTAIKMPKLDPVYGPEGIECTGFSRSKFKECSSPDAKPTELINRKTHFLDLDHVYGNSIEENKEFRALQGGRLKADERKQQYWLPHADTKQCFGAQVNEPCYKGEARVNSNIQLTSIHTVFLREHNRIADQLALLNPHWDDETVFQETRRILIAIHQYIVYYYWLPANIGKQNVINARLIGDSKDGYINDYREQVNSATINSFPTAAMRQFHSAILGHLHLYNDNRQIINTTDIDEWFGRPKFLEDSDHNFDDLLRGLTTQNEKKLNRYIDPQIGSKLFRGNSKLGSDLKAIDIQRSRDHGLGSYNDYREYVGLKRAKLFLDFKDTIPIKDINNMASLYKRPRHVDLNVGASLEAPYKDSMVGKTFTKIIIEQFTRTRQGDRYFFENGNQDGSFTLDQLNELRKVTPGKLFCDNGHHITHMQENAFEIISESNKLVPCDQLRSIDLSLWKENNSQNITSCKNVEKCL